MGQHGRAGRQPGRGVFHHHRFRHVLPQCGAGPHPQHRHRGDQRQGRQLAHRLGPGRRRKAHFRVPQPLHEPQRPQGGHERRKPRHLPLPCHQCHRSDLHSAPDRPRLLPCFVAERHRVPGGLPGRCGRLPLDGARRCRHRHGHQRTDEEISGSHLGTARPVRFRPGF